MNQDPCCPSDIFRDLLIDGCKEEELKGGTGVQREDWKGAQASHWCVVGKDSLPSRKWKLKRPLLEPHTHRRLSQGWKTWAMRKPGKSHPCKCRQVTAFDHHSSGFWYSLSLSYLANKLNPVAISHHRKLKKKLRRKPSDIGEIPMRVWGFEGEGKCELLSCTWEFLGWFWSVTFFGTCISCLRETAGLFQTSSSSITFLKAMMKPCNHSLKSLS